MGFWAGVSETTLSPFAGPPFQGIQQLSQAPRLPSPCPRMSWLSWGRRWREEEEQVLGSGWGGPRESRLNQRCLG